MSESVEMYLVMTALLREAPQQPVAVSLLAGKLGVTQVSANEMCHKLSERGLLAYQPYKGVTLTAEGEAQAQTILSRRRLWVVFLVENLGIDPEEADALACQLEHITSERLVLALKAFLERAPRLHQPLGEPIGPVAPPALPLSGWAAGGHGLVAALPPEPGVAGFLRAQGLAPGAVVEVLAVGADGAVLLGVNGRQLSLAPAVAAQVLLAAAATEHSARHAVWARLSAFWDCPHGEECPRAATPIELR